MARFATLSARLVLAVLSGFALYASYEPVGWWWAGLLGWALLYAAMIPWGNGTSAERAPRRALTGILLAVAHAAAVYSLLLPWVGEYVGAPPFIALVVVNACYLAVWGAFAPRLVACRFGIVLWALWYVAIEWVHSSWPFGGFGWVRVAWGQINGPLMNLAPVGGPVLVTLVTVLAGSAVGGIGLHAVRALWSASGDDASPRKRSKCSKRRKSTNTPARHPFLPHVALIGAVAIACAGGVAYKLGLQRHDAIGSVHIAAVQGNVPRLGLDFAEQREAVLNNHVNQTKKLREELRGNGESSDPQGERPGHQESDRTQDNRPLDFVVWPENSSDINPLANPSAYDRITAAASSVGAPIMLGTSTKDEVGARNTMLVINPDGSLGERYYKRFLQPFGEYMPFRDLLRHVSPYVDMAGDYKPGTQPGVMYLRGIPVGISTCYEVAFDRSARDAIDAGAQILTTPTNNATFGFTDMTYQQLAMSRFRARELDRAVVVAATSGVSAIVHPAGSVSQSTHIFEPATLVETLPLRDTRTLADKFGTELEWALTTMGVIAALYAWWSSRGHRKARGRLSPRS